MCYHDYTGVNTLLKTSTNNGDLDNGDHHGNNDKHPKNITLNDKSHEHDTITMEMPNSDIAGHIGSYSVPVTPMKPYQPSVKISGHHPHRPLFPRRSHSYEHLEELGLSPLASIPPTHSASQSGSGPFRFRGNILASVGSSSNVLGKKCRVIVLVLNTYYVHCIEYLVLVILNAMDINTVKNKY